MNRRRFLARLAAAGVATSLPTFGQSATKARLKIDASKPGATYVTTTTSLPPGFSLSATSSPSGQTCPAVNSLQQVKFSLTAPGAAPRSLTIQVRTP